MLLLLLLLLFFFSSKSTRCVHISVCVSVRLKVSKPIAEHSMGVWGTQILVLYTCATRETRKRVFFLIRLNTICENCD